MSLFQLGDLAKTGVYCWRNVANDKRYVGSAAVSLEDRKRLHLDRLRKGKHYNRHLQAAWKKYGEASFVFEVLESCSSECCVEREQWWMDHFDSVKSGYNLAPKAGSQLGLRMSVESRARASAAKMGNTCRKGTSTTLQGKLNMAKARLGKKHTIETKAKVSAALRGRPVSLETKEKLSSALLGNRGRTGQKHTEETIAKMKAAWERRRLRGQGKHTEETKRKISEARRVRVRNKR